MNMSHAQNTLHTCFECGYWFNMSLFGALLLSLATVNETQKIIVDYSRMPLRLRLRSNQIKSFDWTNMKILIPIGQEYVFAFCMDTWDSAACHGLWPSF